MKKFLMIDLGAIGKKSEKLQELFDDYSEEPNENGWFLKFEDVTQLNLDLVIAYTNCFESKEAFYAVLGKKLLPTI
ncbi:hypothetical protein [Sporosarcina aquimarina]|uniref:hypothetical protein n=1 Tax=Sporosarcina aquimarina TaxID=114975 RepID=UPI001C8E1458|nr:hypothetical protein [Sporosarcina aquimarina]MBY0224116.1 hypothetical protein [Sporosarcina aquimarina]